MDWTSNDLDRCFSLYFLSSLDCSGTALDQSSSLYFFALDSKALNRLRDITGPMSASAINGFFRSAAFPTAPAECVSQSMMPDALRLRTKSVGSAFSIYCEVMGPKLCRIECWSVFCWTQ